MPDTEAKRSLWHRMIHLGVHPDLTLLDAKHVKASNILTFIVVSMRLPWLLLGLRQGSLPGVAISLLLMLVLSQAWLLNARRRYVAANVLLAAVGYFGVVVGIELLGYRTSSHFILLSMMLCMYLIFQRKHRIYAHGISAFSGITFLLIIAYQDHFPGRVAMLDPRYASVINAAVVVSCILLIAYFFVLAIEENEDSLLEEQARQKGLNFELQQEKQLQLRLNHELQQANEHKSKFLAGMSHELRTPLNAILGFTRIVKRKGKKDLPEKQLDNLDKVLDSAHHLLSLINDILDISKIEAGHIEVDLQKMSLVALLREVLSTARSLLREDVELLEEIDEAIPPMESDPHRIKQILLNLLSNAAKFTHQGSITASLSLEQKAGQTWVAASIRDTGIGISAEAQKRIFEEFRQADSSTTRRYGGTGLGLPISLRLAHLLGGDLLAQSAEGEGSTFTLLLPFVETSHQEPQARQPAARSSSHRPLILTIDDDPDMHLILKELLEHMGYDVASAHSGLEGIQKARELKPFAVTLDIMMPKMDGWQVLHELKNHEDTRSIHAIILSVIDNKKMAFDLGASGFLHKPLDHDSVQRLFDGLS